LNHYKEQVEEGGSLQRSFSKNNMADSSKANKSRKDENGSLAGLLAGSSSSTASTYDPATLLCKLFVLQCRVSKFNCNCNDCRMHNGYNEILVE
jgi:hypothetical protein